MRVSFLVVFVATGSWDADAAVDENRNKIAETMLTACRETLDKIPRDEIPKNAGAWLAGGRIKTTVEGEPKFGRYKAFLNADLKAQASSIDTTPDSPVLFLKKDGYLAVIFFYKAKSFPNSWFHSLIQIYSLKTLERVSGIHPACGGAGSEDVRAPQGLVP